MASPAVAIPRHVTDLSGTIHQEITGASLKKIVVSKKDMSSTPSRTVTSTATTTTADTLCEKCQSNIPAGLVCSHCQTRKRKHDGKDRDSEDLKRRSIPSPAESFEALSPESLADFDPSMDSGATISMSEEHAVYIGPTTELESSLFSILDMSHLTGQSTSFVQRGPSLFSLDHDLAARSHAARSHATRKIMSSVGTFGLFLIDAYEKHVHHNFPVIEDDFLMNARHGVVEQLEPTLLAALYAVASPWVDSDSPPAASNLDNIAFGLFTKMLSAPSIHIIQAGLLLMQRPDVDSKTLNSQLIGAAYEIGLHLDCSDWTNIDEPTKRLRRRLAWALYTQDTWCSLIHGRPAWIQQNDWAVRDLGEVDMEVPEPAGSEPSNERALFLHLVQLTKILSAITDTFYTLKAMSEVQHRGSQGTRFILEKAKPVQLRLKNWFSGLPSVLKMDSTESNKPVALGLLHLAYFATEITLHRCIVRSLEKCEDAWIEHICRSAAKTRLISAMDFVNRLRPEHLRAFWYFSAPQSFALIASFGSLLLGTAPSLEEQEFYRTRLNEYRWTIGVSSRTAMLLGLTLETLDQGDILVRNLPNKPPSSEIVVSMPEPMQISSVSAPEAQEGYDSEDSGETMDMEQAAHPTSGLMSPSTSAGDGIDLDQRI